MGPGGYVARRLIQMVPIVLGLVVVVFMLIHLVPGDPVRAILGERAPQAAVDQLRSELGLDRPMVEQFGAYVADLARGDLGTSIKFGDPVAEVIGARLPPTLALLVLATLFAVLDHRAPGDHGRGLGRSGARPRHPGRAPRRAWACRPSGSGSCSSSSSASTSALVPRGRLRAGPLATLHSMFLPAFTIALAICPILIRSLRAALLEVLEADYITTARSKGLSERRSSSHHALRNAIISTISVLGVDIGFLVGGTLVIEQVFAIPGVGQLMINSIFHRDFPVVQA